MATLPGFMQNEDQEEQAQGQPTQGGLVGGVGGIGANAGRRSRQGGFVGLQQYLEANKGGTERLAGTVAQGIEKAGQEAQASTEALGKEAQSAIGAGSTQNIAGAIGSDPGSVSTGQFQRATKGYQGPQGVSNLGGYGSALASSQKVAGLQEQLGAGETGYQGLLEKTVGGPQYTRGLSTLDAALLTGDTGAQERFKNLQGYLGGVQSGFTGLQEKTAGDIAQARQASDVAAKGNIAALQKAGSGLYGGLETAAQQKTTAEKQRFDQLRSALAKSGTEISEGYDKEGRAAKEAALASLGVPKGSSEFNYLINSDASQFLGGPKTYTSADVATPQQRATAEALARLSGKNVNLQGSVNKAASQFDISGVKNRMSVEQKNKERAQAEQAAIIKARKDSEARVAAEAAKKAAANQAFELSQKREAEAAAKQAQEAAAILRSTRGFIR